MQHRRFPKVIIFWSIVGHKGTSRCSRPRYKHVDTFEISLACISPSIAIQCCIDRENWNDPLVRCSAAVDTLKYGFPIFLPFHDWSHVALWIPCCTRIERGRLQESMIPSLVLFGTLDRILEFECHKRKPLFIDRSIIALQQPNYTERWAYGAPIGHCVCSCMGHGGVYTVI